MKEKKSVREALIVVLFSFIVVGGVMLVWITPDSGYHPVDDHEFLMWTYLLRVRQVPLWDLIKEYNIENLRSGRLRPLYVTMRGIFIYLFGDVIKRYYLWAVFKTIVTFILLYYMFREMGAGMFRAMAACIVSMVGYQSCTWWKLGTHEVVCVLWFAAGMIFLTGYIRKNSTIRCILSIISFLIMSLYKESFIVLIPFIMLYALYYDTELEHDPADYSVSFDLRPFFKQCLASLRKRAVFHISMAVIFIAEISIILFVIGQDYLTYESDGLSPILKGFTTDMKWIVIFGAVMSVIIISRDTETRKIWKEAALFLAFVLPQFYVYRSTGITERYLLPFSIGFAMLFVVLAPMHMDIGRIRIKLYYAAMVLLILAHARGMLREGDYYRFRGEGTTAMIESVKQASIEHPEAKVLSCLYYEVSNTIYANNLLAGCDNVYQLSPIWEDYTYKIEPVYYMHYIHAGSSQPEISGLEDMDIIVAYNQSDRHWEYHAYEFLDLTEDRYESVECGTFTIYVRRGSGIELGGFDIRPQHHLP